jgi:hypothetical protein
MRSRQFSGDALANKAQTALLKDRQHGNLVKEVARELFDEAEDIREAT